MASCVDRMDSGIATNGRHADGVRALECQLIASWDKAPAKPAPVAHATDSDAARLNAVCGIDSRVRIGRGRGPATASLTQISVEEVDRFGFGAEAEQESGVVPEAL